MTQNDANIIALREPIGAAARVCVVHVRMAVLVLCSTRGNDVFLLGREQVILGRANYQTFVFTDQFLK